jgi:hypothetical protein
MTVQIQFDQAGKPPGVPNRSRSDIVAGTPVAITSVTPGSVESVALLWKPIEDDTAAVSGSSPNWSITPKAGAEGRYRVALTSDGVTVIHTFGILTANRGLDIPAANERGNPDASLIQNTSTEIDESETNEPFIPFLLGSAFAWWKSLRDAWKAIDLSSPIGHALDDTANHGAPSDNTAFNVSTSAHGLCPKLSGIPTEYLDGDGAFSTPPAPVVTGWKQSVRAKSNVNVDISSAPKSVDEVKLVNGDRVLLADQSTGTEDGIYIFDEKGNPMTRADDAQVGAEFRCVAVYVEEGINNADLPFVCTNDEGSDVVGTNDLSFSQFTTQAEVHELGGSRHSLSGWAAFKAKINLVNPLRDAYARFQWMHKVTAGEVTAGYFTLPWAPESDRSVIADVVTNSTSVRQVNKSVSTFYSIIGITPDFNTIGTTFYFRSHASAGLSDDIVQDDILIITYTISEA